MRRKGRHGSKNGRQMVMSILFGLLIAAGAVYLFNARVSPLLTAYASARLETQVTRMVNRIVMETAQEGAVDYNALLELETNDSGQLTALKANLGEANLLRAELVSRLTEAMSQNLTTRFSIPLGNLTGISILSSKGTAIPVEVLSVGTVNAEYRSNLTEAGVNQTCYQLVLDVETGICLLLPGGTKNVRVTTSVVVAEAVLLGDVPENYTMFQGIDSAEGAAEDYFNFN